jgi:hypothetical protein
MVSLLLVVVGGPGPVQAQTKVEVVNVPEVRVPEPIPHTRIERFLEVPISPGTGDGDRWTLVGEVETDGYPRLMLSLGGEVVGGNHRGVVGAVLVPAEVFPKKALCNKELAPFALRAEAQEKGDTGLFASEPFSLPVSFPKYEVYLFNSGEKPVKANLYVYLTQ